MSRWIDADALKKDIARLHILNDEAEIRRAYEYNPHSTTTDFEETLVSVFDAIDDAPTIEPKRGEWVALDERDVSGYWKCSACGTPTQAIGAKAIYKYCPFCGADMRAEQTEPQTDNPCDGCIHESDDEVLACVVCVLKDKQTERSE